MTPDSPPDATPDPLSAAPAEGDATLRRVVGSVCHRTKNDLQTVANLVALAAAGAADPLEVVDAVEARIGALSVAYTLIAAKGRGVTLDRLLAEVATLAARSLRSLKPAVTAPALELSLRLCSPLALWLHEMTSNAVRHGLARVPAPELAVSARHDGDLTIEVSDNGPGRQAEAPDRLGLRIARAIAQRDLGGEMELIERRPGLVARLVVPAAEVERLNREAWS